MFTMNVSALLHSGSLDSGNSDSGDIVASVRLGSFKQLISKPGLDAKAFVFAEDVSSLSGEGDLDGV